MATSPQSTLPTTLWRAGAEALSRLVVDSVVSIHSRRAYARSLKDFFAWYDSAARGLFTKALVHEYRSELQASGISSSTINVHLAAIRKLASEAADNGLLDAGTAAAIQRVRGIRSLGVRTGNWLDIEQTRRILAVPDRSTKKGKRDYAILALLISCGLRRAELVSLTVEHIAERDGRCVLLDLTGKGNRRRTIPVPAWTAGAIDVWRECAGIQAGRLFRAMRKNGELWGDTLTEKAIWSVVEGHAAKAGIAGRIAPHDLRRTCAKLCRQAGGELEQIQFLLGHASIQTTERYLGSTLKLRDAVNDRIAEALL